MKSLLLLILLTTIVFCGDVYVNGYYRSDGTYVKSHYRSSPNRKQTSDNTTSYTGWYYTPVQTHYDKSILDTITIIKQHCDAHTKYKSYCYKCKIRNIN